MTINGPLWAAIIAAGPAYLLLLAGIVRWAVVRPIRHVIAEWRMEITQWQETSAMVAEWAPVIMRELDINGDESELPLEDRRQPLRTLAIRTRRDQLRDAAHNREMFAQLSSEIAELRAGR